MAARPGNDMPQWSEIYPAADRLRTRVMIHDPGWSMLAGPGQEISYFKERYPELPGRFILREFPVTLNRTEKLPDGVESMEYGFFTPQSVQGRFYNVS
jgi:hypothetical protein